MKRQQHRSVQAVLTVFCVLSVLLFGCNVPDVEPEVVSNVELVLKEVTKEIETVLDESEEEKEPDEVPVQLDVSAEAYPALDNKSENSRSLENPNAYPIIDENFTQPFPTVAVETIPETPSCEYEFVANEQKEVISDHEFSLSFPTVIKTNPLGFQVAGWLPNNQTILITQDNVAVAQTILTLNVVTGEEKKYAERLGGHGNPIWVDRLGGVAFTDVSERGLTLKFSSGDTSIPMDLPTQISSVNLDVNPSNGKMTTIVGDATTAIAQVSYEQGAAKLESNQRITVGTDTSGSVLDMPHLAWSASGENLAVYTRQQLRIVNPLKGSDCQIDINNYRERGEGRIFYADWSPNGRYLAFVVYTENTPLTELVILDMSSGTMTIIDRYIDHDNSQTSLTVNAFAWSPDSNSLFVKAHSKDQSDDEQLPYQLVLVSVDSGVGVRLLPDYTFSGAGLSFALSDDGKLLAYRCPTDTAGQICLVEIGLKAR